MTIAIVGAGLLGVSLALELAERGKRVVLLDRRSKPMQEASRWNEGKLHLGLVYANDPSHRTAQRMVDTSLQFTELLSRWVPTADLLDSMSNPFLYGVHQDSMVSITQIRKHFQKTEDYFQQRLRDGNNYPGFLGGPIVAEADVEQCGFNREYISHIFQTQERALNTRNIADLLETAVNNQPKIELRLGSEVIQIEPLSARKCRLHIDGEGHEDFAAVINASWANRPHLDATAQLAHPPQWITRYKVGVHLSATQLCQETACQLPSTTLVLGPFGDIVQYLDGSVYLSWYPACMFGSTQTAQHINWSNQLEKLNHYSIAKRTIAELTKLYPSLQDTIDLDNQVWCVEGGSIYAAGSSDIDDAQSYLHMRHKDQILHQDCYWSVDSCKYTTAPAIANEVANLISPLKSRTILT